MSQGERHAGNYLKSGSEMHSGRFCGGLDDDWIMDSDDADGDDEDGFIPQLDGTSDEKTAPKKTSKKRASGKMPKVGCGSDGTGSESGMSQGEASNLSGSPRLQSPSSLSGGDAAPRDLGGMSPFLYQQEGWQKYQGGFYRQPWGNPELFANMSGMPASYAGYSAATAGWGQSPVMPRFPGSRLGYFPYHQPFAYNTPHRQNTTESSQQLTSPPTRSLISPPCPPGGDLFPRPYSGSSPFVSQGTGGSAIRRHSEGGTSHQGPVPYASSAEWRHHPASAYAQKGFPPGMSTGSPYGVPGGFAFSMGAGPGFNNMPDRSPFNLSTSSQSTPSGFNNTESSDSKVAKSGQGMPVGSPTGLLSASDFESPISTSTERSAVLKCSPVGSSDVKSLDKPSAAINVSAASFQRTPTDSVYPVKTASFDTPSNPALSNSVGSLQSVLPRFAQSPQERSSYSMSRGCFNTASLQRWSAPFPDGQIPSYSQLQTTKQLSPLQTEAKNLDGLGQVDLKHGNPMNMQGLGQSGQMRMALAACGVSASVENDSGGKSTTGPEPPASVEESSKRQGEGDQPGTVSSNSSVTVETRQSSSTPSPGLLSPKQKTTQQPDSREHPSSSNNSQKLLEQGRPTSHENNKAKSSHSQPHSGQKSMQTLKEQNHFNSAWGNTQLAPGCIQEVSVEQSPVRLAQDMSRTIQEHRETSESKDNSQNAGEHRSGNSKNKGNDDVRTSTSQISVEQRKTVSSEENAQKMIAVQDQMNSDSNQNVADESRQSWQQALVGIAQCQGGETSDQLSNSKWQDPVRVSAGCPEPQGPESDGLSNRNLMTKYGAAHYQKTMSSDVFHSNITTSPVWDCNSGDAVRLGFRYPERHSGSFSSPAGFMRGGFGQSSALSNLCQFVSNVDPMVRTPTPTSLNSTPVPVSTPSSSRSSGPSPCAGNMEEEGKESTEPHVAKRLSQQSKPNCSQKSVSVDNTSDEHLSASLCPALHSSKGSENPKFMAEQMTTCQQQENSITSILCDSDNNNGTSIDEKEKEGKLTTDNIAVDSLASQTECVVEDEEKNEQKNEQNKVMVENSREEKMDKSVAESLPEKPISAVASGRLGKQSRMKKLGLDLQKTRKVSENNLTSPPVTPTPCASYTFTFHVPTPVYKRIKVQSIFSSRAAPDIVVRMHPMDARRYSLLKIGRELVRMKRLSPAKLPHRQICSDSASCDDNASDCRDEHDSLVDPHTGEVEHSHPGITESRAEDKLNIKKEGVTKHTGRLLGPKCKRIQKATEEGCRTSGANVKTPAAIVSAQREMTADINKNSDSTLLTSKDDPQGAECSLEQGNIQERADSVERSSQSWQTMDRDKIPSVKVDYHAQSSTDSEQWRQAPAMDSRPWGHGVGTGYGQWGEQLQSGNQSSCWNSSAGDGRQHSFADSAVSVQQPVSTQCLSGDWSGHMSGSQTVPSTSHQPASETHLVQCSSSGSQRYMGPASYPFRYAPSYQGYSCGPYGQQMSFPPDRGNFRPVFNDHSNIRTGALYPRPLPQIAYRSAQSVEKCAVSSSVSTSENPTESSGKEVSKEQGALPSQEATQMQQYDSQQQHQGQKQQDHLGQKIQNNEQFQQEESATDLNKSSPQQRCQATEPTQKQEKPQQDSAKPRDQLSQNSQQLTEVSSKAQKQQDQQKEMGSLVEGKQQPCREDIQGQQLHTAQDEMGQGQNTQSQQFHENAKQQQADVQGQQTQGLPGQGSVQGDVQRQYLPQQQGHIKQQKQSCSPGQYGPQPGSMQANVQHHHYQQQQHGNAHGLYQQYHNMQGQYSQYQREAYGQHQNGSGIQQQRGHFPQTSQHQHYRGYPGHYQRYPYNQYTMSYNNPSGFQQGWGYPPHSQFTPSQFPMSSHQSQFQRATSSSGPFSTPPNQQGQFFPAHEQRNPYHFNQSPYPRYPGQSVLASEAGSRLHSEQAGHISASQEQDQLSALADQQGKTVAQASHQTNNMQNTEQTSSQSFMEKEVKSTSADQESVHAQCSSEHSRTQKRSDSCVSQISSLTGDSCDSADVKREGSFECHSFVQIDTASEPAVKKVKKLKPKEQSLTNQHELNSPDSEKSNASSKGGKRKAHCKSDKSSELHKVKIIERIGQDSRGDEGGAYITESRSESKVGQKASGKAENPRQKLAEKNTAKSQTVRRSSVQLWSDSDSYSERDNSEGSEEASDDFHPSSNLRSKGRKRKCVEEVCEAQSKRTKRSSVNYSARAFSKYACHSSEKKSSKTRPPSIQKDMRSKSSVKESASLIEGVHYIVVGKFKGHQAMLVKIERVNVRLDERVNVDEWLSKQSRTETSQKQSTKFVHTVVGKSNKSCLGHTTRKRGQINDDDGVSTSEGVNACFLKKRNRGFNAKKRGSLTKRAIRERCGVAGKHASLSQEFPGVLTNSEQLAGNNGVYAENYLCNTTKSEVNLDSFQGSEVQLHMSSVHSQTKQEKASSCTSLASKQTGVFETDPCTPGGMHSGPDVLHSTESQNHLNNWDMGLLPELHTGNPVSGASTFGASEGIPESFDTQVNSDTDCKMVTDVEALSCTQSVESLISTTGQVLSDSLNLVCELSGFR